MTSILLGVITQIVTVFLFLIGVGGILFNRRDAVENAKIQTFGIFVFVLACILEAVVFYFFGVITT